MDNLTFEEAYARLEMIVRQLETGQVTLEESLALFEEGVALTGKCLSLLDRAEARITVLTKSESGIIKEEPYEAMHLPGATAP
ncbi:MAG TPA: exodeoxyribonuclease VII small subunit [Firmicutes bacterium]|nr:exodeoxyribonuclease VII small subunit [Bacillota bacterium]